MSPETVPYLLLAFVLGLVISYLLLRAKRRKHEANLTEARNHERELENEVIILKMENSRIKGLEDQKTRLTQAVQDLERDNLNLQRDKEALEKTANEVPTLKETITNTERTSREVHEKNVKLTAEMEAMKDWYDKAKSDFTGMFATLSEEALRANRGSFLDLARETLGKYQEGAKGDLEKRQQAISELVTPFQTKLREFEQKVDLVYRTEAAERNSLRGEIKTLVEKTQEINTVASNLASALKRDTKQQGNWGELILEKVLEFSGLRKGMEYKLQESVKNEEGKPRLPDAIIYLPENKHIIIDSKVSLISFERYCSADSEEERSTALLQHIASVKKHIKDLSETDYPSLPTMDSPEFTLLFMPIESSFGLAIQADNELFEFAWNRKIVIVSPSTLLATLRTIASIWKQERQTKNALDIADRAGKMYDKFVGFVEDLISVGNKMDDAKKVYEGAMNKLSVGTGNLVRQSEHLKEMGAKATKQLPGKLLDRAIEIKTAEPIIAEPFAAGPDAKFLKSV